MKCLPLDSLTIGVWFEKRNAEISLKAATGCLTLAGLVQVPRLKLSVRPGLGEMTSVGVYSATTSSEGIILSMIQVLFESRFSE